MFIAILPSSLPPYLLLLPPSFFLFLPLHSTLPPSLPHSLPPSLPPFLPSSLTLQGMEYLHSRGISHGRLCTSSVYIHNRVCIKFRPQVCLPRRVSCDDLVSLPPEDVRTLAHSGGSLMLPNPPALKPDIFAFG